MLPKTLTGGPDWTFDANTAKETLHKHFGVLSLSGFGFDDNQPCLVAAGGLLIYLQQTMKASLAHLRQLKTFRTEQFLRA